MSIFDDLADPLGPPTGDALGRVVTRARRRRVARRRAAALTAVVAIAAIAVSASALGSNNHAPRIVSNNTTVLPTTVPTSATSPATTTIAPTTTPSTVSTTTPTTALVGRVWTDPTLTITPRSLGRVRLGMTITQAQGAAGLVFDGTGDGAFYSTRTPTGYPHLFVRADPNGDAVSCVGAEIGDAAPPQTVVTPEGFRLGDTVQRLMAIYGSRARYIAAPVGGISPRAGYVVTEPDGNLAFYVDNTRTRIFGIKGGGHDLTPSSCSG